MSNIEDVKIEEFDDNSRGKSPQLSIFQKLFWQESTPELLTK